MILSTSFSVDFRQRLLAGCNQAMRRPKIHHISAEIKSFSAEINHFQQKIDDFWSVEADRVRCRGAFVRLFYCKIHHFVSRKLSFSVENRRFYNTNARKVVAARGIFVAAAPLPIHIVRQRVDSPVPPRRALRRHQPPLHRAGRHLSTTRDYDSRHILAIYRSD